MGMGGTLKHQLTLVTHLAMFLCMISFMTANLHDTQASTTAFVEFLLSIGGKLLVEGKVVFVCGSWD